MIVIEKTRPEKIETAHPSADAAAKSRVPARRSTDSALVRQIEEIERTFGDKWEW